MSDRPLSIVSGPPLAEEAGIGALTLGGWLREVTARDGEDEALVYYEGGLATGQRVVWSRAELWERANEVARALMACGVGKGTRVGVLMTNRPEFLSAVFGIALAGGVAATFSTFSTRAELDHLLAASAVSVLLVERQVLKKDFVAMAAELEPGIATREPGGLRSARFPYLTHIAAIGEGLGVAEPWDEFLARGSEALQPLVDARAAAVAPADPGVLFFSSGSTALPKGILSAHRGVTLQLWRWPRWYEAIRVFETIGDFAIVGEAVLAF